MSEFLVEYGLFLAKTLTVVVAVLAAAAGVAAISARGRPRREGTLQVRSLDRDYESMAHTVRAAVLPRRELRRTLKGLARRRKDEAQRRERARLFVLSFHGDIQASAVRGLREEITAVLLVAEPRDEVLLRLETGGGLVHAYGLAAAQLARLKDAGLRLTVAVDKVAASGGYLMACVADRILAAPFAVVGSIGVVSQLPNFNRLLKKHDIDFEQFTAGEYKRTVTLLGENTDKARAKVREEVEETHRLFKAFVHHHRPDLDVERVATGEHWYGQAAVDLGLVDELRTSDDFLLEARQRAALYAVRYTAPRPMLARLSHALGLDREGAWCGEPGPPPVELR